MNYRTIKNKLKKKESLKFEDIDEIKEETIEDFLYNFFVKYNRDCSTVYTKTLKMQAYAHSTRSLGDIYIISKYYFKDISLMDIIYFLYSRNDVVGHFCNDIGKRVYSLKEAHYTWVFTDKDEEDEYDLIHNDYKEWIKEYKLPKNYKKQKKEALVT